MDEQHAVMPGVILLQGEHAKQAEDSDSDMDEDDSGSEDEEEKARLHTVKVPHLRNLLDRRRVSRLLLCCRPCS